FACGCQSSSPTAVRVSQPQPQVAATGPVDHSTFTPPKTDTIRVEVVGVSVKRPGFYDLAQGANVRDAINAAMGLTSTNGWHRPYSGILRRKSDGGGEFIWFKRDERAADEQRVLQNNDRVIISHEVYY